MGLRQRSAGALAVACALAAVTATTAGAAPQDDRHRSDRHVLLLSVDGLHQADLDWFVAHHPDSALAKLVGNGVAYTHAQTPVPSDSFPGMVGQVTGGNPATTGVYYDDSFNHALLPPGTTTCTPGQATGTEVSYTELLDKDPLSLDAGQGLAGLPDSILQLTGAPQTLIDPSKLPVDPKTCKPVYPHQYLKVNTVFEVARQHGLRTAWSDKHAAYEILNGPSGTGVQDLFTPEINSQAAGAPSGVDWTKDNAKTQQYDGYKVQAVLNEIDGYDHSRGTRVGVPGIFGMNFQSVSTAEKLPKSGGLAGGYLADGVTPGPVLSSALDFVDQKVGALVGEIAKQHLAGNTTVILSAKHGQSPTKPAELTRIADGKLMDGLNAAWKAAHPGAGDLVAQSTNDDAMMVWLTDRSQAAADFAKKFLLAQSGTGTDIDGKPKAFTASGLATVYAGAEAARYFHVSAGDSRVPDLFGVVQQGVVYTGGKGKIAEHGGAAPADRDVPLVVSGAHVDHHEKVTCPVETTQIAPTILRLLNLDPSALQAVRHEHTRVLPDLR
ncbi:alkaline phosphatase family protein [Solihabitans fulvus]|uniref:Alkaline phosphatase family protein n=1 Tax=Solihabitans fulvus TaxID=1892852 RepID=A0A5B2X496_9PSEU|nr:alkaline phosphatase family protein [Solihabitans fulvus]KAA2258138.1 alkaline phosphatase family protein [Solihabitans fulvus]